MSRSESSSCCWKRKRPARKGRGMDTRAHGLQSSDTHHGVNTLGLSAWDSPSPTSPGTDLLSTLG